MCKALVDLRAARENLCVGRKVVGRGTEETRDCKETGKSQGATKCVLGDAVRGWRSRDRIERG